MREVRGGGGYWAEGSPLGWTGVEAEEFTLATHSCFHTAHDRNVLPHTQGNTELISHDGNATCVSNLCFDMLL